MAATIFITFYIMSTTITIVTIPFSRILKLNTCVLNLYMYINIMKASIPLCFALRGTSTDTSAPLFLLPSYYPPHVWDLHSLFVKTSVPSLRTFFCRRHLLQFSIANGHICKCIYASGSDLQLPFPGPIYSIGKRKYERVPFSLQPQTKN